MIDTRDIKYYKLENLLCHFNEGIYTEAEKPIGVDPAAFAEQCDRKTIKSFIEEFNKESISKTIEEGKTILSWKEFPTNWIMEVTNRYPFHKGHESTDGDYYEWIKWIIDTLEAEASNKGKL